MPSAPAHEASFVGSVTVRRFRNTAEAARLWANLDRCAQRNQRPELVHLRIRQRNTPIRPIDEPVEPSESTEAILNSMHHNQGTGIEAVLNCPFSVGDIWIRDVHGQVEPARGILAVQNVVTLWGFVIAGSELRPNGISPQCDVIVAEFPAVSEQCHAAQTFLDDDSIRRAA